MATTVTAEGDYYQRSPQYPAQNMANQYYSDQSGSSPVNPWSLPQQLASPPEFQPYPKYYDQPDPATSPGRGYQERRGQRQRGRFVTPDVLESLKQQQRQHQVMPENQHGTRQYWPAQPGSGLLGQGGYGYPLYGTGSANPLYDAPAVSPWGNGADVLNRGGAFPMVPSEAIGGFSPMHVPSFGMNNYKDSDSGEPVETDESNVFNPFTFLPNRSLREP